MMQQAFFATQSRIPPRSFFQLFLLEALAGACVLGLTLTMLTDSIQTLFGKAYLTEALWMVRGAQVNVQEQLALRGALPLPWPGAPTSESADLISGSIGSSKLALNMDIMGDHIMLRGNLPRKSRRFTLAYAPSLAQDEPAGSVMWLCGHAQPLAGWSGPIQGPGTSLPPELTPFTCRAPAH